MSEAVTTATLIQPATQRTERVEAETMSWHELVEKVTELLGYDVLETAMIEADPALHERLLRDLHETTESDLLSHEDLFGET